MKNKQLRKLLIKLVEQVNDECNSNKYDYKTSSNMSYTVDYTYAFLTHLNNYETLRHNN